MAITIENFPTFRARAFPSRADETAAGKVLGRVAINHFFINVIPGLSDKTILQLKKYANQGNYRESDQTAMLIV
jgi:hypothetical protein